MSYSEEAGKHPASGVHKRKSTTFKACFRCHRRKQRCTGYPICSNCESANATCTRDSDVVMRKLAGLSKEELLDRIDSLEARLSGGHQNDSEGGLQQQDTDRDDSQDRRSLTSPESHGLEARVSTPREGSPGIQHHSHLTVPDQGLAGALWPDDATGKQILNTYLESMHRRVPFFDFGQVAELHNQRYDERAMDPATRFRAFKLHMVYAIGATVLKLTKTDSDTRPEDHVEIANRFKNSLKSLSIVERIEAALFSVLYRLRLSLDSSVWYEIGLAMRMIIEEGMHREAYYQDLDLTAADWARRLFWGVYVMERNVCFSLKRPLSIADHDIDAGMPSLSIYPPPQPIRSNHPTDRESSPSRATDLSTFVAIVSLVRIKSQMHTAIYRADADISSALGQVRPLLGRIREFEQTLPVYTGSDQEFLQLHVNNAVRTLVEPFLTMMDPSDELMSVCVEAAGRVCQLFKRLRLRKALGYSFPMVNSVFVAGMTICYVLFKNPLLWTPAMANDLRACSSILFVIAERNQSLRKYCDVLETIINGVMQHIEDATTPSPLPHQGNPTPCEHGESPIAFHKLKDTFKRLEFELPSHVYPDYTTDSERKSKVSPNSSQHSGAANSGAIGLDLHAPKTTTESYDTSGGLYFGSDMLPVPEDSWDMSNLYDIPIGDVPTGLYAHEPYTQQMMDELLAQSYFDR